MTDAEIEGMVRVCKDCDATLRNYELAFARVQALEAEVVSLLERAEAAEAKERARAAGNAQDAVTIRELRGRAEGAERRLGQVLDAYERHRAGFPLDYETATAIVEAARAALSAGGDGSER